MKEALIFGSTGLIGNHLYNLLLKDNYYTNIKLYVRKNTNASHPKVEIINIDFNNLENYSDLITGDDCYFCIGTTKKETPTKDSYRMIEYDIPVGIAKIAKKNNINSFIYVSSLGSNPTTKNTYLRNKGQVEEALKILNFHKLSIIRPSLLLGPRNTLRLGEFILQKVFKSLSFLFRGSLKKYAAIDAENVARAMINISKNNLKDVYFDSNYLQNLSKKI